MNICGWMALTLVISVVGTAVLIIAFGIAVLVINHKENRDFIDSPLSKNYD